MSTNSRPGRKRRVDRNAVFALALQPHPPVAAPCAPTAEAVRVERAERAALLSRRGRAMPHRSPLPQVPPT